MSITSQTATMHSSMNHDNVGMHVRTDQGQVVERVNLRVNSKGGKKLYNEKLIGNTLIPHDYPLGTNKVIGWCNDYASDAIIYFVHNSNANHSIMRYYINTKSIEKIWYSEKKLGFEDSYVKAVVVDGMLYWVQEDTHPKSLDIQMAVNYMLHLYGGVFTGARYSVDDKPFDEVIFPLIKRPPQFAPTCEYGTDATVNYNNLRKHQFQFKYCYEYANYQRSAWSPISKIPLPTGEILSTGKWIEEITTNNYITVSVNTGSHQVTKILLGSRDANPNNAGTFFIFEEIEKFDSSGVQIIADDIQYEVDFYNNKRTESINTTVDNRYCDHVPIEGSDILLLDNKWLSIAYPLVGYDLTPVTYKLTPYESDEVDTNYGEMTFPRGYSIIHAGSPYCGSNYTVHTNTNYVVPTDEFHPNAIYSITVPYGPGAVNSFTATYLAPSTQPAQFWKIIRDELYDQLSSKFNDCAHVPFEIRLTQFPNNAPLADNVLQIVNHGFGGNPSHYGVIYTDPSFHSYKSFKRGQYHSFGIIYNDGFGRYNVVSVDPSNNEFFSPPITAGNENKYVLCDWEISSTAPDWAKTYRWCYIKNKTYTYFLYVPNVTVYRPTDNDTIPSNYVLLRINEAILDIINMFPNTIIPTYEWVNGDRVRIVGSDKSFEILREFTPTAEAEGEEDPEPDNTVGFLVDDAFYPTSEGVSISLIEIYRPNPEPQEIVYNEFGEEFEVIGGLHMGQTQDQTATLPATGTFDFGDVYFRERIGSDAEIRVVEDAHFSDYYESDSIDIGRPGAKLDLNESKQKYLNAVVRSENFLEKTAYNLLNVWLPVPDADRFEASDQWGKITGIQEVGDVLKVIQEHKETSIYVGKMLAKEADGSDIYLDSSNVFGTVNKYIEVRGSKYIRSIVKNNRYLYYFDDSTSEFIRSSANGQLPISSKYHMRNWFETKAKLFREYVGNKDIIVSCDNDYDETMISFVMGNDIESLVFSEEEFDNGWKYFATFKTTTKIPDNFAFQGDTSISWMDGQLYLHNVGAHNMFYGEQWGCYIKAAINVPGGVSKRFANIYINSDRNEWDIEFTTEDRVNYGPQKSYLKPSIIKEVNGRLHSTILRNILKRDGVTEDLNLLYNNHDMVGEVLFVKLSSSDSDDVSLGEIEVKFHINW